MTLNKNVRLGVGVAAQSFGFFGNNKWLAIFPLLSLIFACVFIALVAVSVFEVGMYTDLFSTASSLSPSETANTPTSTSNAQDVSNTLQNDVPENGKSAFVSAAGVAAMFGLYFCTFFIFTFFNVALAACVLSIFEGKPVGFWGGLTVSVRRLKTILGWSFLAALVGSILRAVESRGQILTNIFAIFSGLAWSLATFFVIPIIASKNTGPISAVKESVHIMQQVWGKSVVSNIGIKGVKLLILAIIVGGVALTHLSFGSHGLLLAMPIIIPLVLLAIFIFSTVGTISRAALYYYATEQTAPLQFDDDTLLNAITRKA